MPLTVSTSVCPEDIKNLDSKISSTIPRYQGRLQDNFFVFSLGIEGSLPIGFHGFMYNSTRDF